MKIILSIVFTILMFTSTYAQYNDNPNIHYYRSWPEVQGGFGYSFNGNAYLTGAFSYCIIKDDKLALSVKLNIQKGLSSKNDPNYSGGILNGNLTNSLMGFMLGRIWDDEHTIRCMGGVGYGRIVDEDTQLTINTQDRETIYFPIEFTFIPNQNWGSKFGIVANLDITTTKKAYGTLGLIFQFQKPISLD